MNKLLALLLVLGLAFAGCADEPAPEEEGPADDEEEPGNEPEDSTGPNQAPGASITASITQGEVPQDVTFMLDGSDANGDALTWTLDATGDGEPETEGAALPANYTHSYVDAGVYLVTFTVTDGVLTAEQNITVNLTTPEDPNAEPAVVQESSASWSPGQAGCGAQYGTWNFGTPAAGLTHAEIPVDAATWGQEFIADLQSEGALFIGIDFYDASGAIVGDGGTVFAAEGTTTGAVPVDAAWVLAYDCFSTAGNVDYRTTGKPPA